MSIVQLGCSNQLHIHMLHCTACSSCLEAETLGNCMPPAPRRHLGWRVGVVLSRLLLETLHPSFGTWWQLGVGHLCVFLQPYICLVVPGHLWLEATSPDHYWQMWSPSMRKIPLKHGICPRQCLAPFVQWLISSNDCVLLARVVSCIHDEDTSGWEQWTKPPVPLSRIRGSCRVSWWKPCSEAHTRGAFKLEYVLICIAMYCYRSRVWKPCAV